MTGVTEGGVQASPAAALTPGEIAATLAERIEHVLASGHDAIRRLSYARTSVRLAVRGTERAVTLLFDRSPVSMSTADEAAEVEIVLTPDQAERFARGLLHLPTALEGGVVETRGPLRKYLEVDPILREALRRAEGAAERPDGALNGAARPRRLPEDLLSIETRDLHKSFGGRPVLKGVDLAIPEGVISIVLGPSGTGKSVLLNHVTGIMKPDRGDIIVRGRSLNRMSRSELLGLRLEVGVMFQDGALFSAMNVFDNVAFPLRQHTDLGEDEIEDIVMWHLKSVGLADAARKRPNELSGGMRKRAGLARALVLDPGIVLCDEPDSGLDPVRTALLGELLAEQHAEQGGTMVVITHNIPLAKSIGEHVSVLWQGKIVASGSAERVFGSDDPFVRQFLESRTEGPLGMDA
jgi:phospholipid/cholesterol/gamma-HCH transport system ATP-binding protein